MQVYCILPSKGPWEISMDLEKSGGGPLHELLKQLTFELKYWHVQSHPS